MRWWFVVALGCLGCNRIFDVGSTNLAPDLDGSLGPDADPSIDLDRDGTRDIDDPCIAPDTDLLIDSDGDGSLNGADLCPFDATATPDSDGDGIGDRCDPFPQMAGDRRRCIMAFTDPELDVQMWRPRETPPAWLVAMSRTLHTQAQRYGSVRADWPFEDPKQAATTYRAYISMYAPYGEVGLMARSPIALDAAGVGCLVAPGDSFGAPTAIGGGWTLRTSDTNIAASASLPSGTQTRMWLTVTFAPGRTDGGVDLHCSVRFESGLVLTVDDTLPMPAGTLALYASTSTYVWGLTVDERDDAPL